jgi:hypothetical protein
MHLLEKLSHLISLALSILRQFLFQVVGLAQILVHFFKQLGRFLFAEVGFLNVFESGRPHFLFSELLDPQFGLTAPLVLNPR